MTFHRLLHQLFHAQRELIATVDHRPAVHAVVFGAKEIKQILSPTHVVWINERFHCAARRRRFVTVGDEFPLFRIYITQKLSLLYDPLLDARHIFERQLHLKAKQCAHSDDNAERETDAEDCRHKCGQRKDMDFWQRVNFVENRLMVHQIS